MGKIAQVSNLESGSTARAKINTALEAVETDATITGDGNLGSVLSVSEANLDASAIPNTPAGNIAATNIQAAINELDTEKQSVLSDVDIKTAYENNANTNAFTDAEKTKVGHISVTQAVDLDDVEGDVVDLRTLTGTVDGTSNLGAFTGTTISDNTTIKAGMQELETAVETNNTSATDRLAALEKDTWLMSSTGVVDGLEVTGTLGGTTFDVAAGTVHFYDTTTDPANPTEAIVTYPGATGIAVTNVATQPLTYIGINSAGTILQQGSLFTASQRRSIATVAVIIHPQGVIIDFQEGRVPPADQIANQIGDLVRAIGPINMAGNDISANGANLNIDKSAGTIFAYGLNQGNDPADPSTVILDALTAPTFTYTWRDGVGGWNTAASTTVVPGSYDDGTGGALVPDGVVSNNQWSIHRVYVSPGNVVGLQYGQSVYGSESAAIDAIQTETYEANPVLVGGLLRGFIIAKGNATDLTTDATFIGASRFGGIASGPVGGVTPTLQSSYDLSSIPQILTDAGKGALTVRGGTGTDTDSALTIQNNAGTDTVTVQADGSVGVGKSGPTYKLDVVDTTGTNQLHLNNANTDDGLYFTAKSGATGYMSAGIGWNGTEWRAKSANYAVYGIDEGILKLYGGVGQTIGNTVTPQELLRIDPSTGRLGIGTDNPQSNLHIETTEPATRYKSTSHANYWEITTRTDGSFDIGSNGSTTDFKFTADGRLGIGTDNPQYRVHVLEDSDSAVEFMAGNSNSGTDASSGLVLQNDLGVGAGIALNSSTKTGYVGNSGLVLGTFVGGGDVAIATSNTTKMTVDTVGNVGIGTTSPNTKLELMDSTNPVVARINNGGTISNESKLQFTTSSALDGYINHQANTGKMTIGSGRSVGWGGHIAFEIDTAQVGQWSTNGDLGVGGSFSPTAKLHVRGNNATVANIESTIAGSFTRYSDSTRSDVYVGQNAGVLKLQTSATDRLTINTVGIVNVVNAPTYADDTAAGTGGLVAGDIYKTATGELRIKL